MGILAPLVPRPAGEGRLFFTSGAGSLMTALLFLFFGAVAWIMWFAVTPLLAFGDPFLQKAVAWFLIGAGTGGTLLGLATLGYRQTILLDGRHFYLETRQRIFGIPFRGFRIAFGDINRWEIENITPKRYRPELNPQNRPAGFWQISVATRDGRRRRLERAPREEEIRWLSQVLQDFIQHQNKGAVFRALISKYL